MELAPVAIAAALWTNYLARTAAQILDIDRNLVSREKPRQIEMRALAARQGSNLQPSASKADALSVELRAPLCRP